MESMNPTIKTGANRAQMKLATSTFRGTKGDEIKKFLNSQVQDATQSMLKVFHRMKAQRMDELLGIRASVNRELIAKDGEQEKL
jgi:hypothetical protein